MPSLVVNDQVAIPEGDLTWTAVRASGPGGQNVNKVSSKVELRFDLAGTDVLDAFTKERLRRIAGSKVSTGGELLLTSQKTRDQARNLEDARAKLVCLIQEALFRPKARRPTRPSRARVRARLDDKRKQGDKKASRRTNQD
jgi:ribosome-associated protein